MRPIDQDGVKIWLEWNTNTLIWGDKDGFVWDQVFIVKRVAGLLSGGLDLPIQDPLKELNKHLNDEESEKLIKVICQVNNIVYVKSKKKGISKKITIDQIHKTIEKVIGVKIDM